MAWCLARARPCSTAVTMAVTNMVADAIDAFGTAEQKETAKKFFSTTLVDDAEKAAWVKSGGVPVLKNSDSLFQGADAQFLKDMAGIANGAKTFAQSWDQALSPTAAETLLDNIAKLFQLQVTPDQWIANMNQVIGK